MAPFTFTKPQFQVMALLATVVVAMLKDCNAWVIPPTIKVRITNRITPLQDLTLGCKSKNNNIGVRTIRNGESYGFKFKPVAIMDITLFFCKFWWPTEPRFHYLDIYDESRDNCTRCFWKIWEYGGCMYNDYGKYTLCLPWKKGSPQSLADAPSTSNTTRY